MALKFSHLTRDAIRRLKTGEKINEHGIMAERLKAGDVRYTVNIMVDGQRIHRVIGRDSEGVTRTQCENFIETKKTEAREDRLSLPKSRKTHLKFSKAAVDYIQRLKDTDGKNVEAKERQLKLHLKPFFKDQRIDAISTFTVDRYKKRRQEAGASNGTINRELATLSHIFNAAIEWKWLKALPCKIKLFPESPGRIIALDDEQADALLKAAIIDRDVDCWLFVQFGLNTAMRHSEILKSRFDQIDFDKLRLYIPNAKAGMREQPITPELAATLRQEREMREDEDRDGWIFPSPRPNASGTGHRHRMGKAFRRAVTQAELDPEMITPHVMRHTAITNLVQAGVDLPTIQKISGHKTLTMVLRYTHVHGLHIDEAIKNIGRALPEHDKNPHFKKRGKLRTVGEQNE
jgi:integrase